MGGYAEMDEACFRLYSMLEDLLFLKYVPIYSTVYSTFVQFF